METTLVEVTPVAQGKWHHVSLLFFCFSIMVAPSLFLWDKTTIRYKRPNDNYMLTHQTVCHGIWYSTAVVIFADIAKKPIRFHRDFFFGTRTVKTQ